MKETHGDSIAIVGIAVRFPGAGDVESYWENLESGRESVQPTGLTRAGEEAPVGSHFVPSYGVLEGVDRFDAAFFGFNPREAALLDPQQRIFLELSWSALENAGYCPERVSGPVGVYAGVAFSSYLQLNVLHSREYRDQRGNDMWKIVQFNTNDFAATRVAHKLDLHGPAVVVQSACSTSLVAVHSACQALLNYECDMALAGGASLLLPQDGYWYEPGHILSPDGRCRPFDALSGGTVPGSGAGIVALKRLDEALADGDFVRAVVRGTALNNDGARKAGYTAPSPIGQAEVIRAAHAAADVDPDSIGMLECHGTGTALGDPIEVRGLQLAFGEGLPAKSCALGSVKGNIGHLDTAAGVAGFIKACLALEHGVIPPSLHFDRLNPEIDVEGSPFYVNVEATSWPRAGTPRRAGVSSFGIGGTNAHAVLEEAPARAPSPIAEGAQILTLSARSAAALQRVGDGLASYLEANPSANLADVAYTLQVGRRQFHHRRAVPARDPSSALTALRGGAGLAFDAGESRRNRPVVFLFSGQGSQRPGMGAGAWDEHRVYRDEVERCLALLPSAMAKKLRGLVFTLDDGDADSLARTELTQPALFVLEYALARQWQAWGVEPAAMVGHSLGEFVAATVAGVFELADALGLIVERGRLMQEAGGGAMLAVRCSAAALEPRLGEGVELAAINSEQDVVVSGGESAVEAFAASLARDGLEHHRLQVSHAFHSAIMDGAATAFAASVARVPRNPPSIPILSNVSGTWLTDDEAVDPAYWGRQLRAPVRFSSCVNELLREADRILLEVGPGRQLLSVVRRSTSFGNACTVIASLDGVGGIEPRDLVAAALARLWCAGADIDWGSAHEPGRRRLALPGYPFERERYWLDPVPTTARYDRRDDAPVGAYGLSGTPLDVPGDELHQVLWIGPKHQPYLADHVVHGRVLVPASFYMSAMLAMGRDRLGASEITLGNVQMLRPLVVDDELRMHIVLRPTQPGHYRFAVSTADPTDPARGWVTNSEGTLTTSAAPCSFEVSLEELRGECPHAIDTSKLFDYLAGVAVEFGPRWRWMQDAYLGKNSTLVRLASPTADEGPTGPMHPGLIDNGLGSGTIALASRAGWGGDDPVLPYAITAFRFYRPILGQGWCQGTPRTTDAFGEVQVFDLVFWNDDGEVAGEIEGFTLKRAPRRAFLRLLEGTTQLPLHAVGWRPLGDFSSAGELSGTWAVCIDRDELAARVAASIAAAGGTPAIVHPAGLGQLGSVAGVICAFDPSGEVDVSASRNCARALELVHQIQASSESNPAPPRVCWMLDRDSLPMAPLVGFGRVVQSEHPEWRLRLLELDPGDGAALERVASELSANDGESHVRLQNVTRWAARLLSAELAVDDNARAPRRGRVLVTGGLGALGLAAARGLVSSRRAAHLVLVGRGEPGEHAVEVIEELRAAGASVETYRCDVAELDELAALFDSSSTSEALVGVVHAAGALDDGVLSEQSPERFDRVLGGKLRGAWNLHRLTADIDLDFFVMFSSVSSVFGSAGQSNYAAANSFLDGLAEWRRSQGLPAHSIAWAPWTGAGMAASLGGRERARLSQMGLGWIEPERGLALLEAALDRPQAALVAAPIDVRQLRIALGGNVPSLLGAMIGSEPGAGATSELLARLQGLPVSRRSKALREALRAQISAVIGVSDVPADQPLQELGLDSLTALELRNGLASTVGQSLPATLLFDHPTIDALADYLLNEVLSLEGDGGPASNVTGAAAMAADEPIAVIGMGCRFPGGVNDLETFWSLLDGGVDAVSEIPEDRWDVEAYFDPDPEVAGKMYTRWGGFLSELDRFDPQFFGISPREAQEVDPQLRLLLEVSWEALERAGHTPDKIMGSATGVYVGICGSEYQSYTMLHDSDINAYTLLGTACSAMVGRLSYFLGLKGPNFPIDTACSSSLVALHTACQALRAGDCEMALVGGVNTILSPKTTIYFSRLKAMSPTGRCRTFSADADGYVRGEGCGVVLIKPLSRALADGDRISAVIRGTAVNQDGRSQGMTAPNGPSQEAVIRQALRRAALDPNEIDYVECHGTGTPLGDPIEARALGRVFSERPAGRPLYIGSVKSNFGHTEGAAGIAGLIKTILAFEHGALPASLHADSLSPHVPWSEFSLEVCRERRPWVRNGHPRRAGVSSFGFSGTNAHAILEEPPLPARPATDDLPAQEGASHTLLLSAKRADRLPVQAARLARHLVTHPDQSIAETARALARGRAHFGHRCALVVSDRAAAIADLETIAAGDRPARSVLGEARSSAPRIAFLFSGQGAQRAGMGAGLYRSEAAFRHSLDRSAEILATELEVPLLEILFPDDREQNLIHRTGYTQPALFALELALADLWQSRGVTPAYVLGHSVGEYVAACVAGILDAEDGLRLIAARGRLMQALDAPGAMVAVTAPEERVVEALAGLGDRVSIAAVNGPEQIVISGAEAEVLAVSEQLSARGAQTTRLTVSHAFHSPLMEPMLEAFASVAASIRYRSPLVPLIRNLDGGVVETDSLDASYWVGQVRKPVRFQDCVDSLLRLGVDVGLEIGPHPVLAGMAARCAPDSDVVWLPSLRRGREDAHVAADSLAALFVAGVEPEWPTDEERKPLIDVPTYPFARDRYWFDEARIAAAHPDDSGTAADDDVWSLIESGDAREALLAAGALSGDAAQNLDEVLAALLEFRRERRASALVDDLVYQLRWRKSAADVSAILDLSGRWLVCGADRDLAATIAGALEASGASAVCTTAEPESIADLTAGEGASGVVLCGLELDAYVRAARSVLASNDSGSLWFVTRAGVGVDDSESVDPAQAAVWGLARVASLEHSDRWGGIVDLPTVCDDSTVRELMRALSRGQREDQLALRGGGQRFVPRLTAAGRSAASAAWATSGTAVITGGLGAVGRFLARWVVARGAERVVLTSRRGPESPGAAAISAELEALGAQVVVARADVADATAMSELWAVLAEGLPVRSVFHAAGVVAEHAPLREVDPGVFSEVIGGKGTGAEVLDWLVGDQPLDAFVCVSSIASVWGAGRQASYASANAYLDGVAARRRAAGRRCTTINFGPWAGAGMAAQETQSLRRLGLEPQLPERMLEGLERVLDRELHQAVIADVNWESFRALYESERERPLMSELPGSPVQFDEEASSANLLNELRGLDGRKQRGVLQDWVRAAVAGVIGMPHSGGLSPRTGFFDLGLDSLMAVELRKRVQRELGLKLSATVVFNYPHIEALSTYLLEELGLVEADGSADDEAAAVAALEAAAAAEVDGLDEDELSRLIDDEWEALQDE